MKIKIGEVIVGERRRDINPDKVQELASSIKEIGLLNPITIGQDKNLIAGLHRLKACQELGIEEIECNMIDLSGLQAELAEIDENLIRNELHYIDRGDHLKRRKEIYEQLYPETKAGKVKSEKDLHHSLRLSFISRLIQYGLNAELEFKVIPDKKYRIDIAMPEAKVGIEIYTNKYCVNKRDLIDRTEEIQKKSDWIIEWYVWGVTSSWEKFLSNIVGLCKQRINGTI